MSAARGTLVPDTGFPAARHRLTVIGVAALLSLWAREAEVEDARRTVSAHLLEDFRRLLRDSDAAARGIQFRIESFGALERRQWRGWLDALVRSVTARLQRASIIVVVDHQGGVIFFSGDAADRVPLAAVLARTSPSCTWPPSLRSTTWRERRCGSAGEGGPWVRTPHRPRQDP